LKTFENLNIREADLNAEFLASLPPGGFDLIVVDVSFISLTKVVHHLTKFLKKTGYFLLLVKPQFEAGSQYLDKKGIIKKGFDFSEIEKNIREICMDSFGIVLDYFESEVPGKDGNKEYFIYGQKK
jgi:23S rRNA (cytidine1920-2'-O)/16S rRNA (cytidine1409-2'-O)-methyltransferase